MPVLPLFTLVNIILILAVWLRPNVLEPVGQLQFLILGRCVVSLSGALSFSKRVDFSWTYDLFLLGGILVWFVYWREIYCLDAPLFKFYPAYFVLLSFVLTQLVVDQVQLLDSEQVKLMQLIYEQPLAHPALLVVLTLAGLYYREWYVVYPIAVSFVCIRYVFAECLRRN